MIKLVIFPHYMLTIALDIKDNVVWNSVESYIVPTNLKHYTSYMSYGSAESIELFYFFEK